MPPLADIIQDVIHRDACPLNFRATAAIDDLCTHGVPRLSCLMQPHARSISGGLRAVHDTEWGLDSRSLDWMKERGGRCPSLDDCARNDNGLHTLSARAAEPFPQRESTA